MNNLALLSGFFQGFALTDRDDSSLRSEFLPLTYLAKLLSDIEEQGGVCTCVCLCGPCSPDQLYLRFPSSSEPFRGARECGRGVCGGDGAQADAHPAGFGGGVKGHSRAEGGWTELWGTSDGWKHGRCKHGGRRNEPNDVSPKGLVKWWTN